MIAQWNGMVTKSDTVYHLGDVTFGDPYPFISRLNGKIFLVPGNHDRQAKYERLIRSGKVTILPELYRCSLNGQHMTLCHYALATWDRAHHGSWMLHGHSHGTYQGRGKILDVGVDNLKNNYSPISFDDLKVIMDAKSFEVVDHHGD